MKFGSLGARYLKINKERERKRRKSGYCITPLSRVFASIQMVDANFLDPFKTNTGNFNDNAPAIPSIQEVLMKIRMSTCHFPSSSQNRIFFLDQLNFRYFTGSETCCKDGIWTSD